MKKSFIECVLVKKDTSFRLKASYELCYELVAQAAERYKRVTGLSHAQLDCSQLENFRLQIP
jgi:hypothetical protein